MRLRILLLALLLPVTPVTGQAFARLGLGATGSSDFVKDFIAHPIAAKQSVAPTGVLLIGWRMQNGYRFALEGRYARGTWKVDDNGTSDDLGGLATLAIAAVADGPISGALRWEAAAGQLRYLPEQEIGLFAQGGPSRWMLGGGVTWTRPLTAELGVVLGARYDFHGFNSDQLQSYSYSRSQSVHRVALTVAVERGF